MKYRNKKNNVVIITTCPVVSDMWEPIEEIQAAPVVVEQEPEEKAPEEKTPARKKKVK